MPTFSEPTVQSLLIVKEVEVAASADIVFESILAEIGGDLVTPEGSMPMKIEPWPGGRWYRDLGNNTGHLWGHVQVIKPPKVLEITGPMFMSFPVLSHLTYRVNAHGDKSLLVVTHRIHGLFPKEYGDGATTGWSQIVNHIRDAAERRAKK